MISLAGFETVDFILFFVVPFIYDTALNNISRMNMTTRMMRAHSENATAESISVEYED